MGCLPFGILRKRNNRKLKKEKTCLGKKDVGDDPSQESTMDVETIVVDLKYGVPFEAKVVPDVKPLAGDKDSPKPRPSVAEKVASAEAAAILANVKRLEARVKRKEEAKEAKRLRKLKSEQNKKDDTTKSHDKSAVPDQTDTKANLKDLDKRCKASKRIRRIALVLRLSGETTEGLETTLSPFFRF